MSGVAYGIRMRPMSASIETGTDNLEMNTRDTQTDPQKFVGLFNYKEKKKPYDITINNNRREPTAKPNVKYTEKQQFRKYKTKIEPRLLKKIEINEDDDIVNKIKEALGVPKKNSNYSSVTTAGVDYIPQPSDFKEPEIQVSQDFASRPRGSIPRQDIIARLLEEDFSDMTLADAEDITNRAVTPIKETAIQKAAGEPEFVDLKYKDVFENKRFKIRPGEFGYRDEMKDDFSYYFTDNEKFGMNLYADNDTRMRKVNEILRQRMKMNEFKNPELVAFLKRPIDSLSPEESAKKSKFFRDIQAASSSASAVLSGMETRGSSDLDNPYARIFRVADPELKKNFPDLLTYHNFKVSKGSRKEPRNVKSYADAYEYFMKTKHTPKSQAYNYLDLANYYNQKRYDLGLRRQTIELPEK